MTRLWWVAIAILFLLLVNETTAAQVGGRIGGRILDESGGAVSEATVILQNIAAGTEQETVADPSGQYEFYGVPIGIYRIRVRRVGFSQTGRNVELAEPGETLEVNFELTAGMIAEQVTVTATRGERDTLSVPIRTETLDEDVLSRQNPAGTGDALLNVPNLTPVNSGPYLVRPRLRGFDSTRVLILVDGERLNNSRTSTGAAGVEVGLIDPGLIDTVEVVHGAGSALYGTDALSGTINIITQMPRTVDQIFHVGGSFTGYYSSNENGRRGTARIDLSGRRFAARFSGMLERFPNYHAGSPFNESNIPLIEAGIIEHKQFGPIPDNFNEPFVRQTSEILNSQEHGNSLNALGRWFLSDRHMVKINWIRRRAVDVGFADFTPPYFFQLIKLPGSDLDKASLRYEATGLSSWFSRLSFGGYWQHQDRRLFNDFFVLSQDPSDTPSLDYLTRVDITSNTGQNVKSFGYDLQANFLIGTRNLLTVGSSLFRDHSKDFRQTEAVVRRIGILTRPPLPPRFIPLNALLATGVSLGPRVPISNFQNFAVFLQDEYELTSRLRVIGSLRVDRFDIDSRETPDYDPRPPELDDAEPPIDISTVPPKEGITFNRSSVTGDIGLVYRVMPSLSLTARVGRSYRHPNLSELFFSGPAESGVLVPDINLVPEQGINLDLGMKLRTTRVSGALTYFHNWYKDFLSRQLVAISRMSGGEVFQALNFSRVRIQGVEADWDVPFQVPSSFFSFFGDFSYLWGEVIEGRNPLARSELENAPLSEITPLKIVAGLRWNDRSDRFWWEYSIRSQTHVNRVSPLLVQSPLLQAQDLWSLNGFTIHNLRGGVNLVRAERARLSVTLGLENLGNKFYREQFQFAPARGRSFTLGFTVTTF